MTGMANCTPSREGDYDRFQDVQDSETLPVGRLCECECGATFGPDDDAEHITHLAYAVETLRCENQGRAALIHKMEAELHDTKLDLAAAEHDCAKAKKLHAELAEFASATCDSLRDELDRLRG